MWAPHPRGRVIRRPQPDFSHRRARLQKRPSPKELADDAPDPRRNCKYFGIHRSDVTDYLKQTIPSHAFHPSLIGAPPPVSSGRCIRKSKENRRPETAPAATAWFGRTCTDISDWLRYRPPAHLGLDTDNKPLPYHPTSTSIVTDAKWQTKEFPVLPNVLWHWWADRPTSVPLATNPQAVKFDTLVDAVKHRVVRPSAAQPSASPRSGAQTPRDTPRSVGSETSRSAVAGGVPTPPGECTPRPGSAQSAASMPRPGSAPSAMSSSRPLGFAECFPRAPATPRPDSAAESVRSHVTGSSGKPPDTPRGAHGSAAGTSVPGTPRQAGSAGIDSGRYTAHSAGPSPRGSGGDNPAATTSKPQTPASVSGATKQPPSPQTPASGLGATRPPPSPRPTHPNPPHVPKHPIPRKACPKYPAAVSPGLYVQGQSSNISAAYGSERSLKTRSPIAAKRHNGSTLEEFKNLSPDAFATRLVWEEKFKNHGQGSPWPLQEKKIKSVKAY